jgi:hypothetical protein
MCPYAGDGNWRWSLLKVKVSNGESAYFATSTRELADEIRATFSADLQPRVVQGSELPPDCHRNFADTPVLLIDSPDTLALFRAQRGSTFPYRQHTISYADHDD